MPITLADGETENHERCHGRKSGPGGGVLQQRPAQHNHVNPGDHGNHDQGQDMSTVSTMPATEEEQHAVAKCLGRSRRGMRLNLRQERQSSHHCHAERRPAVEERRQVTVSFAQSAHIGRRSQETSCPVRRRQSRHTRKSGRPGPIPARKAPDAAAARRYLLRSEKMDEPMTPPTSNNTESSKVRPRTSVAEIPLGLQKAAKW